MDIFLLLSHLAANYFKTHDENNNLHFAWSSWRTEIMESGNDLFFSLHRLNDQLDHACHGYERYHLSWERLSLRMLMLIFLLNSRIDQQVSSIWTNLSLYCAISSQMKNIPWFLQIIIWPKRSSWTKGGWREERCNGLPPFPRFGTTCLLEHLHRHWESENKPLLFFLGQPPSPLVAIWQVEAKINWRRTQASQRWVVWCSRSRGGPEWNRGEGGAAARYWAARHHSAPIPCILLTC